MIILNVVSFKIIRGDFFCSEQRSSVINLLSGSDC